MACILRASGRKFQAEEFCVKSPLMPCRIFRKGEPRFPKSQPQGPQITAGGLNIVVSAADFHQLARQVKEAIAFLRKHSTEIKRLVRYPGVESVGLDFGITWKDVIVQGDYLPAELIRLAGALGLDIEISHYPVSEKKRSLTPRSTASRPRWSSAESEKPRSGRSR